MCVLALGLARWGVAASRGLVTWRGDVAVESSPAPRGNVGAAGRRGDVMPTRSGAGVARGQSPGNRSISRSKETEKEKEKLILLWGCAPVNPEVLRVIGKGEEGEEKGEEEGEEEG